MTRTTWNHVKNPDAPLRWRKPRLVRVTLTGSETDAELDRIFAVMALAPAHTFEVLAAAEKMASYLNTKDSPLDSSRLDIVADHAAHIGKVIWDPRGNDPKNYNLGWFRYRSKDEPTVSVANRRVYPAWPLPNVHIGTTCRTQAEVDHAVPILLSMPNAHPWLRLEPSEGISLPIHMFWKRVITCPECLGSDDGCCVCDHTGRVDTKAAGWTPDPLLRYIELSGQTGPDAKPLHPQWARQIRDDCAAANVPFRFEGWGEWRQPNDGEAFNTALGMMQKTPAFIVGSDGNVHCFHGLHVKDFVPMIRVGRRKSGRTLDGAEHDGQIGGGK